MDDFKENVIEFIKNEDTATVSFTQERFITKIKKLAEQYPEDVQITHVNKDGSIVAHIPVSYIKLSNLSRNLTDEQRQAISDRLNGHTVKDKTE